MDNESKSTNPLLAVSRRDALGSLVHSLRDLRERWDENGISALPVPIVATDSAKPRRDWMPECEWMTGLDAFNIFLFQSVEYAPAIARICQTISDQADREEAGLNYVVDQLPPNNDLLADFALGSNQWFRALYSLLTQYGAKEIDGWERYVSDLHDWLIYDHLRIRARDVLLNAVHVDWPYYEYSLPEAKQNPVWSFPHAMAWIATRDYLALARLGVFYRSKRDDSVATDGVCMANTRALGWLQSTLAFAMCKCGAFQEFRWEAARHCTCLSIAWEDLVKFSGGLTEQTPEIVYSSDEHWISMTWPDGADKIRFLRSDILKHWPANPPKELEAPAAQQSTTTGEQDCRQWLVSQFAADPEKRRSKKSFRDAALEAFPGRLSERGFNLRVWPELARKHGRDSAGAKRKS